MGQLSIAFFGTGGDFAMPAVQALVAAHRVVAIVRARARGGSPWRRLLRRVRGDPLSTVARAHRIPIREAASRDDPRITELLERARPDLICIAGYRWILPPAVLALAPLGGLNLHGSLLPRHRGMLPLFWIYYHDDRKTGVTVHAATERADTGDIGDQASFALPRGLPVGQLNRINGERGAALMTACVRRMATGDLAWTPQDERMATEAPLVRPGAAMTRFDEWDVERVWHFLSGLYPWFVEPLRAPDGRVVRYRGISGYERTSRSGRPGIVEDAAGGYLLHCRDGVIRLSC